MKGSRGHPPVRNVLLMGTVLGALTFSGSVAADGEATYNSACVVCHAAGVAGAPMLGDKAAWAARIAKGKDSLYQSSLKGLNAMPPKGGNASLSDADVQAAVDYMISKAQ
ncbi:MAG: c-type cytochrome [Gammaproteobacteria bacterium]|jgi:cytochrome c5|nr:c-type cytochrome [Gammaproteobacteria bacterium]